MTSPWVQRMLRDEGPASDRTGTIKTGKADRPVPQRATEAHKRTVACLQGRCEKGCRA